MTNFTFDKTCITYSIDSKAGSQQLRIDIIVLNSDLYTNLINSRKANADSQWYRIDVICLNLISIFLRISALILCHIVSNIIAKENKTITKPTSFRHVHLNLKLRTVSAAVVIYYDKII